MRFRRLSIICGRCAEDGVQDLVLLKLVKLLFIVFQNLFKLSIMFSDFCTVKFLTYWFHFWLQFHFLLLYFWYISLSYPIQCYPEIQFMEHLGSFLFIRAFLKILSSQCITLCYFQSALDYLCEHSSDFEVCNYLLTSQHIRQVYYMKNYMVRTQLCCIKIDLSSN